MAASLNSANSLQVLFLLHDSRRSGVPAVLANVIRSLSGTKVKPVVWFAYDGVYADELRSIGVEVLTIGPRIPFVWRANRFLLGMLLLWKAREFPIIHVSSKKLAFTVITAKWSGAKVVFHLHERPGKIGWLLSKAVKLADCVVFCARNCAEHFRALPARQKRVILNAIAMPEQLPKISTLKKKIVMLGSINRNKGQHLLLQAFSLLNRDDAELYFYGTVGLSAHGYVKGLKLFVTEHGLEQKVFFPGPTSSAETVYREATMLVHTSLQECLSIAVMEALSFSVPVIANDIIGMDEIVADGVNGYLVPPGDIELLAERISCLLDDDELCRRMGDAGRQTVRDRFNIETRIAEYMALYEDLATK